MSLLNTPETTIIALHDKIRYLISLRFIVVHDVSLSYSSVPYKGVLQITTDSETKNVCWESSLNYHARITVCRYLGYSYPYSFVNVSIPTDAKDATFSGSINCNYGVRYLSQCSITVSASESCSGLSYIECECIEIKIEKKERIQCRGAKMILYFHILGVPSWYKPLLEDKRRFPNLSFSASASSEGHSASDARASSGSSWCAPLSDGQHHLQVDLGRLFYVDNFVTYGDSNSPKWVATYNLNYTIDFLDWKTRVRRMNK